MFLINLFLVKSKMVAILVIILERHGTQQRYNQYYYIDTDEIPGYFLLLKNYIFIVRIEDTIFIFHAWGYWCRHGY